MPGTRKAGYLEKLYVSLNHVHSDIYDSKRQLSSVSGDNSLGNKNYLKSEETNSRNLSDFGTVHLAQVKFQKIIVSPKQQHC